jgi:hypothetical protein
LRSIFGYLPSLGFSATEHSWILSAFPIAAIVGMFFSNPHWRPRRRQRTRVRDCSRCRI